VGGNPLRETVIVQLESQATVELPVEQVSIKKERLLRKKGA